MAIAYRFLCRGGTAANLASVNEIPLARELVFETDTRLAKLGDGATPYNDLPYTANYIEFGVSATHIQWRVVGDPDWIDLVALADLKGADGDDGDDGDPGPAGGPTPVTTIVTNTVLDAATHRNKWIEVTNGAEITLPVTASFALGDFVELCQADGTPFTIVADTGVTIAPFTADLIAESRFQGGSVYAKAIAADTWRIGGALADAP